jgi:hypothetical protein
VTLEQEFDGLGAELGAVEAIEHDRPSSSLSVSDLSVKIASRAVPRRYCWKYWSPSISIILYRTASAAPLNVIFPAGSVVLVSAPSSRPRSSTMPSPFTANDNDILVANRRDAYTLNEVFHIKRMFRHEDDVWTSVGSMAAAPQGKLWLESSRRLLR